MYPRPMRVYIGIVCVAAAGVLGVSVAHVVMHAATEPWVPASVLAVMVFITAVFPVRFIRGNGWMSVQLPVLVAASIIIGPALAAWVGTAVPWTWRELRGEVRWPSIVFNRAQFGIIAWASAVLFRGLGGSIQHLSLAQASIPLASAATLAFFLNMFFMVMAFHFRMKRPVMEIWRVHFKWLTFNFWAMLPIAYLMAAVYSSSGVWPEFLFLIPLGLSRWIFALFLVVQRFYKNTVDILMTALDTKDPYTRGHAQRVARYAGLLARQMEVPEDQVEEIVRAAALHDIGKLGIPDQILNKPAALTEEETIVIQRHPLLGGAILSQIESIGYSRDWVLHHHERWDGQGYPHQLAGEAIPLAARIIAVVDAYDAMTSDRPYRQAMPHEAAMEEIRAMAGSQFDPTVVQAFVNLVKDGDLAEAESRGADFHRVFGPDIPYPNLAGAESSLAQHGA
jgi:HD-GYP domain-containing protein (c-di-GMP phosphodiesterase class II)